MNKLDNVLDTIIESVDNKYLYKFQLLDESEAMYGGRLLSGRGIRNGLHLWEYTDLTRWFHQNKIFHPDDMSGVILTALHRKLNGKTIDMKEQGDFYDRWWTKMYGDEHHPRRSVFKNLKKEGHNLREWLFNE